MILPFTDASRLSTTTERLKTLTSGLGFIDKRTEAKDCVILMNKYADNLAKKRFMSNGVLNRVNKIETQVITIIQYLDEKSKNILTKFKSEVQASNYIDLSKSLTQTAKKLKRIQTKDRSILKNL